MLPQRLEIAQSGLQSRLVDANNGPKCACKISNSFKCGGFGENPVSAC